MKMMKLLLALVILVFSMQAGFTQEIMNREATERPIVFTKKKKDKLLVGSKPLPNKDFRAIKKPKPLPNKLNKKQAPKSTNTGYIENKNNLHKKASKSSNKHKNRWG